MATITKSIDIELPDYEVEIDLEPEDILPEFSTDEIVSYLCDNEDTGGIVSEIGDERVLEFIDADAALEHGLSNLPRDEAERMLREHGFQSESKPATVQEGLSRLASQFFGGTGEAGLYSFFPVLITMLLTAQNPAQTEEAA